jgi:hypothetical protein
VATAAVSPPPASDISRSKEFFPLEGKAQGLICLHVFDDLGSTLKREHVPFSYAARRSILCSLCLRGDHKFPALGSVNYIIFRMILPPSM